ncbi:MAG: DUF4956 domain-containing protein [Gemmatimonadota bacterium]
MADPAASSIVVRLVLYYAVLFGSWVSVWTFLPSDLQGSVNDLLGPVLGVAPTGSITSPFPSALPTDPATGSPHRVALIATFVCTVAVILALPIAWVYMYTRQKKGYTQSVVHTIVLLPAVVAAIAVLVRNNIALAFSLAGIVAAVRFRTSLEDSRDAVFVFAVSALGLAAGVHVEFASILSMLFSSLALILWYTDFGRTPPSLEGQRAEQAMQRALEIANRTSQFVARVDREILESLAPAQLDALADRVRKRRGQTSENEQPFDGELTVKVTDGEAGRVLVESLLKERTKRWSLIRSESDDGESTLVYGIKPRRGLRLDEVAAIVQREGVPFVVSALWEEK